MGILLLTQPGQRSNIYGRFAHEILKSEGFANLTVRALDGTPGPLTSLDEHDAVILTASLPRRAEIDALVAYVSAGGRLIVLRPSRLVALALGLTPVDTVTYPAYVRPGAAHPAGAGVPRESIQTHVPADHYEPAALPTGSQEIARLYLDADTPTSYPAILDLTLGHGRVVVFTYDLPQAVALVRQGNPALAGWRTVGYRQPYRPNELFTGWVDPRRVHLPQADIHTMLFGNAINAVARAPQPRWWYYPSPQQRSVVVLDSDDDWSAPEHFEALLDAVERHHGHITVYLMMGPTRKTIATPERVATWRARGHSFGIHHNTYDPIFAEEEQDACIEPVVRQDLQAFREQYGDVPLTNRNHSLIWKGYVDLARLYASAGVVMDLNYVSLFQYWQSYLTGSGRPMRFVDTDGEVLDVFQQATIAFDDASVKQRLSADPVGEAARTRRIMEANLTTYFAPLSMLSHPVSFFTYSSAYMNRCWDAAEELGIPLWSAFEWAAFTKARDAATIAESSWQHGRFRCRVSGASPHGQLTLMLPVDAQAPRAAVDGIPVDPAIREVFGYRYVLVPVPLSDAAQSSATVTVDVGTEWRGDKYRGAAPTRSRQPAKKQEGAEHAVDER
jgi:hypothetical protein